MHTVTDKQALRALLAEQRRAGKSIGLVPTMGNLHDGHLELVRQTRAEADCVVCTIFVNPLQFGPNEDLDAYPRTLEDDIEQLTAARCDILFAPAVAEIYGADLATQTRVSVPLLSDNYCGRSRPGHFEGVATIVCKLFNLVQPEVAAFGLKDYQQFLVIRKLVADLEFNIRLLGVEIRREASGLAMSSRNRYLSAGQRQQATALYRTLCELRAQIMAGERDFRALEQAASARLADAGAKVDYLAICNADSLQPAAPDEQEFVIVAAAHVGPSRLLDNIRFTLTP